MTATTFWHGLSHLGVSADLPPDLRKKVMLSNRISATVFVVIGLTSVQFFALPLLFGLYVLAAIVYGSPLLFNLLGRHTLARMILVYAPPFFIIVGGGYATDGPPLGMKYALLSVLISPLLLFQITEKVQMWLGVAWVLLAFLVYDPITWAIPRLPEISSDLVFDNPNAQLTSILLSLCLFVAAFVYLQRVNQKVEEQRADSLAVAEKQNQVIRDQNLKLQGQFEAMERQNEAIQTINHELRLQALKAQINPHFVFNALNSIQHFVMQKNPLEAIGYLSKFSKLIRQVLENSVNERVPVGEELKALGYYMELEKLRFGEVFTYQIEVDEQLDVYNTEIPAMLLQPYVENAIIHGLRHCSGPSGLLKVLVLYQFDHLLCIVEDNGIGRAAAGALAAQRPAGHISRGTTVTDTRLRLLNNEVGIVVMDRHAPDGSPAGTRVEITIPIES